MDKRKKYNDLLNEIRNMAEESMNAKENDIDIEIATTMRELRQFIERLRRMAEVYKNGK